MCSLNYDNHIISVILVFNIYMRVCECVCVCEPQIEQKAVAAIGTRTIVLSLDHRHPKTMATPIIEPNLNVDANSYGHWLSI